MQQHIKCSSYWEIKLNQFPLFVGMLGRTKDSILGFKMVALCYMAQKLLELLHSPLDVVYLGVGSPSDDSDGSRNFGLSLVKVP